MILFQSDWARFPNAIADYSTTNETFVRMASLYRAMGVENCLFPLALLQPELQGVDPFDETLSEEIKVKIGLECRYNPWYFLREVVRIPPVAGPTPIPYKANRGNLALTWSFLNSVDIALIQPRQTGKSVSTDCIMVWMIYIGTTNTLVNMITKDNDLRTKNVERLKKIRDLLPKYIVNLSKQDSDNQINLTCLALKNSYLTGVAQNSESAANNLGRGLTSPVFHIDEGPFIRYIGTTLPAALAAGTAAKEEARENGRPYGNIFTTTAGKKDDRDGRYMYDLIQGGSVWNEIFLDCQNREELVGLVKTNCTGKKLIINATFSHRQLGKTDQWLYDAMADSNSYGEEADRDFLNIWTSGSQSSPLSVELNERIKNSEREVKYTEISKELYIIRWYVDEGELEELVKDTQFILGLDTSDAIGRDSIAMVFMDVRDLKIVGAATINETNLIRFSHFLGRVLIKYSNTTLIPERKSSAQSIIDSLLITLPEKGIDPFKRIYNQIVDNYMDREREYAEIQQPMGRRTHAFYDRFKGTFGFNTTGTSRDLLYSIILQNAAKNSGHLIHDKTLSTEIRNLVVKNGRIDHASGGHDDMVIAWLMNHWLLTHSKNLGYYGIETKKALSKVNTLGKELTAEEEYEYERMKNIRKEIEELYNTLVECADDYLIAKYESRLRKLDSMVPEEGGEGVTIDSMINKASEMRLQNHRKRSIENRQKNKMDRRGSNPWMR